MTDNTTVAQKAARRKLNLLELAVELDNVSKACKIIGYSRQRFYEIRRDFQTFGSAGLLDKARGAKNPHPNRVSEELEKIILDYCLEYPTQGSLKVSWLLTFPFVFGFSGIYLGQALFPILPAVVSLLYFKSKRWQK